MNTVAHLSKIKEQVGKTLQVFEKIRLESSTSCCVVQKGCQVHEHSLRHHFTTILVAKFYFSEILGFKTHFSRCDQIYVFYAILA